MQTDNTKNEQLFWIRLTPKASSNRIGEIRSLADGKKVLAIYVTTIAEDGRANEAMLELLAKHLKIPIHRLKIVQGDKSRNKLVRIIS
jgi:uncharacterized protein YggU (UPF0235/DUF167 family)